MTAMPANHFYVLTKSQLPARGGALLYRLPAMMRTRLPAMAQTVAIALRGTRSALQTNIRLDSRSKLSADTDCH